MTCTPNRKTASLKLPSRLTISGTGSVSPEILLHPGGGGAQYPFRFKPFRPSNLWRRTPGPRPPRQGSSGILALIGLLVVIAVAVLIVTAVQTGLFGLVDSKDSDVKFVDRAVEVGFQVESNIIHRSTRTLNGNYEGIKAVILIPRNNVPLPSGFSEAARAAEWLGVRTNWDALSVDGALVICEPVLECVMLATALREAASGG